MSSNCGIRRRTNFNSTRWRADWRVKVFYLALVLPLLALCAQAEESLVLLPAKFKLSGFASHQQLLVEQSRDKRLIGQVTNDIVLTSSDPKVVKIDNGVAVPVANGIATIQIRDGGPGIPSDELEKVFTPFYRLETSRSRESGGTGLGLTIARNICEHHGGSLTLHNHPEGGLLVTLKLPGKSLQRRAG